MAKAKNYDFMQLYERFIHDSASGRRLQRNGRRLGNGTVQNYRYLHKLLLDFEVKNQFPLHLKSFTGSNKREFTFEKKYWKKFYRRFLDYMYNDLNCFDNYVGANMKMLRTFFNYVSNDLGLFIGNFHKNFYVRKEEIPIVVLSPEQLNFLIFDKEFEMSLNPRLKKTKDIFVFGCTVALRVSDLMLLKPQNLEVIGEHHYVKIHSKKTQTYTRIKLPIYAIDILRKYKKEQKTLLPYISLFNLNKNIRLLIEAAGWTQPCAKTRWRRGKMTPVYKGQSSNNSFRFCDLVTSHTMRRTAITTMLSLGMAEHLVRKISGHSANSREFFRYVALSQLYLDAETQTMFEKLGQKTLDKIA